MNELAIIFIAQIVYVSLVTVRWIILVKGARIAASALSFFEILIYAYTLTLVVGALDDTRRLLVYAGGYAVGCYVGTWLEARLAYGTAALQCQAPANTTLADQLTEAGFRPAQWSGTGRDTDQQFLLFLLKRKQLPRLLELLDRLEPEAVLVELEPRSLKNVNFATAA